MLRAHEADLIDLGVQVADSNLRQQVKIWSRHTDEKADVARSLTKVIRTLSKAAPLTHPLRALSIGSGDEPQLRILQAAFEDGLTLFDLDETALAAVNWRAERQMTTGVKTVLGDYTKAFARTADARHTLDARLGGRPFDLVTLHHALYYSEMATWGSLVDSLYNAVLSPLSAIHVVLMSATPRRGTTTWLYNHFAEKFFGHRNDQDLLAFKDELVRSKALNGAQLVSRTGDVRFFVDDFEQYMAVVWMIMLYPQVHDYSLDQKREITRFVLDNFWFQKKPLVQTQDYLAIYKGVPAGGLV